MPAKIAAYLNGPFGVECLPASFLVVDSAESPDRIESSSVGLMLQLMMC